MFLGKYEGKRALELQKIGRKELKYDTFGQILSDSNPNFDFPFRFAGGLWDEDTKLIRFGVRDYDPEVGRWTSKEPLGFAGSRNFYVYAGNDSINYYDINGFKPGDPFNTPDEAAIDALEYIYDESMLKNQEMGGFIYQGNDGCYYAGEPILGSFMKTDIYPDKFNIIAFYHSHPFYFKYDDGLLGFSDGDGDAGYANKFNIDAYLINALKDILKYHSKKYSNFARVHKIHGGKNSNLPCDFYEDVLKNGEYIKKFILEEE